MRYDMIGDGDAIVLVHGLGGSSSVWWPQVMRLGKNYRLILPELPGSARSPLAGPLSIAGFVEQLVALLDAQGLERALFVGHSLGTLVLQHLAAAHPDRVGGLALVAPVRAAPNDDARDKIRARATKVRTEGMGPLTEQLLAGALAARTREQKPVAMAFVRAVLLSQDPEGYARTCEASAAAPAPEIAAIQCPTLIIGGTEDAARPAAESLAVEIPGARLTMIPDSGHWLTIEQPDLMNDILVAWLAGRDRVA